VVEGSDDESEERRSSRQTDYVAISLYYVDGPVSTVELKAKVQVAGEKKGSVSESEEFTAVEQSKRCGYIKTT
jgi:hypothetical protein